MSDVTTVGFHKKKCLGSGTYGRVYAVNSLDGDEYAVKRMFLYHDGDFVCSIRELDLLINALQHPFIVKVKYIYNENPFVETLRLSPADSKRQREDNLWMVMEKARGSIYDLYKTEHMRKKLYPHLPKIFAQFLLGLDFIHNHNIIHLDIKPENVLVFWDKDNFEETLTVKISDLGCSKHASLNNELNISKKHIDYGVITAYYRAPEVIAKCPYYNKSVDIWSAGVMFYFLLTNSELLDLDGDPLHEFTNQLLMERIDKLLPFLDYIKRGGYPECSQEHHSSSKLVLRIPPVNRLKKNFERQKDKLPPNFDTQGACNLIKKMLILDYNRPTPNQLLTDKFFEPHASLIESIQSEVPHNYIEPNYYLNLEEEQYQYRNTAMTELITKYYNSNQKDSAHMKKYYDHRVMFLAIDLIDRCFIHDNGKLPLQPEFPTCSNKLTDKDVLYNRSILLSYSCLYIALKYFEFMPPSISEILPTNFKGQIWKDYLYYLEIYILRDILVYAIYRLNVYEVAKRRDPYAIKIMIQELYLNVNKFYGKSPSKVYEEMETKFPPLPSA